MYGESSMTSEIQELMAVSAEYLGMGTDAVVACRDLSVEPFGGRIDADVTHRGSQLAAESEDALRRRAAIRGERSRTRPTSKVQQSH